MNQSTLGVVGLVAAAAAFAGVVAFRGVGRVAPTPGVLEQGVSYADAIAQSEASGKPVVLVATADWCPPCQMLKKNTLTDTGVARLIADRAIAVSLNDATDRDVIRELGVRAYPSTIVVRGGKVASVFEGYAEPAAYTRFLDGALASAE